MTGDTRSNRPVALFVTLLVACRGVSALMASFNITLSSLSPYLQYAPVAATDPQRSTMYRPNETVYWNTTFSDSKDVTEASGAVGKGTALHVGTTDASSGEGASLKAYLWGRAFYVFGDLGGYKIIDDFVTISIDDDRLYNWNGQKRDDGILGFETLPDTTTHTLTIKAKPNKPPAAPVNLTIEKVVVTAAIANVAEIDKVPNRVEKFVVDGKPNPFYGYRGNWSVVPEMPTLLGTIQEPGNPFWPQVAFKVPFNTAFLVVRGGTRPNVTGMSVGLNPTPTPENYDAGQPAPQNGNWIADEVVWYYTALDPSLEYEMTIGTRSETGYCNMVLQDITFYSGFTEPPIGGGPVLENQASARSFISATAVAVAVAVAAAGIW